MADVRVETFDVPAGIREALDALKFGASLTTDRRSEAWLPSAPWAVTLGERMTEAAGRYAAEVLGTTAVSKSHLLYNRYRPGESCQVHIDQYTRRTHPGPETLHRTVSASLIVERAARGGNMVFQDYDRAGPLRDLNPEAGHLILFPADWWHKVMPVAEGVRRSIVGWWANETGRPFRSTEHRP